MYNIRYFKAGDQQEVIEFMKAHPFVILCGVDVEGFPVATHIPVLLEERDGKLFITGHLMRKQDHTNAFATHSEVLVIFSGPHAYISASWYSDPRVASTWNYQAVHAKGQLQFLDDHKLYEMLVKLTGHFEKDPNSPSQVKEMSEEYINSNMSAIIAFEVEVKELKHVFKLSQNHSESNYKSIIQHLEAGTDEEKAVARVMAERKDNVYSPEDPIT
ncbi:FMN-binding negative transcriptional regulator [Flavihumibacter rivuli]|uniref:FMN-binding negative transcriptional regulator n=1 Tax=Flavihumibacter rivuli TaxID=2838156 RepID=UPI001BDE2AB7|nr:FMN-binding negative transcriptional regulator [Flavihumibacter rivuli]ULQ56725.1 FMN-binding negative transcriptional regulator [Flavihumibacter rivuli]